MWQDTFRNWQIKTKVALAIAGKAEICKVCKIETHTYTKAGKKIAGSKCLLDCLSIEDAVYKEIRSKEDLCSKCSMLGNKNADYRFTILCKSC